MLLVVWVLLTGAILEVRMQLLVKRVSRILAKICACMLCSGCIGMSYTLLLLMSYLLHFQVDAYFML